MERLQKYLAACGVASRRKSEELIANGHVSVNDVIVTELGTQVGNNDVVKVDGVLIAKEEHVYYVLNKPVGYITTVKDEKNRPTVLDLFEEKDKKNRIYPVGRLDFDTAGVLLVTNDGEFSNKLTKANFEIEKEYVGNYNKLNLVNYLKEQLSIPVDVFLKHEIGIKKRVPHDMFDDVIEVFSYD